MEIASVSSTFDMGLREISKGEIFCSNDYMLIGMIQSERDKLIMKEKLLEQCRCVDGEGGGGRGGPLHRRI